MTPEETKRRRDARVRQAWADLALDPSFRTVFEEDLQLVFNIHHASFQGPDYNTHAAAVRDGRKEVISYIFRRLAMGQQTLNADEPAPPNESTLEFQGTSP